MSIRSLFIHFHEEFNFYTSKQHQRFLRKLNASTHRILFTLRPFLTHKQTTEQIVSFFIIKNQLYLCPTLHRPQHPIWYVTNHLMLFFSNRNQKNQTNHDKQFICQLNFGFFFLIFCRPFYCYRYRCRCCCEFIVCCFEIFF